MWSSFVAPPEGRYSDTDASHKILALRRRKWAGANTFTLRKNIHVCVYAASLSHFWSRIWAARADLPETGRASGSPWWSSWGSCPWSSSPFFFSPLVSGPRTARKWICAEPELGTDKNKRGKRRGDQEELRVKGWLKGEKLKIREGLCESLRAHIRHPFTNSNARRRGGAKWQRWPDSQYYNSITLS